MSARRSIPLALAALCLSLGAQATVVNVFRTSAPAAPITGQEWAAQGLVFQAGAGDLGLALNPLLPPVRMLTSDAATAGDAAGTLRGSFVLGGQAAGATHLTMDLWLGSRTGDTVVELFDAAGALLDRFVDTDVVDYTGGVVASYAIRMGHDGLIAVGYEALQALPAAAAGVPEPGSVPLAGAALAALALLGRGRRRVNSP